MAPVLDPTKRDDHLAMIGQKCFPALISFSGSGAKSSEIHSDGPFRNAEVELEQLTVYSWRSPFGFSTFIF
jgi:hypothetical protein